jgi:hypothetical protein
VSGGHHPGFDAVCHALAAGLGAELTTIAGADHGVPRTGAPFNTTLEAFLSRAA